MVNGSADVINVILLRELDEKCNSITCVGAPFKRKEFNDNEKPTRKRIQLASDKIKVRYVLRSNTEGFNEGKIKVVHIERLTPCSCDG